MKPNNLQTVTRRAARKLLKVFTLLFGTGIVRKIPFVGKFEKSIVLWEQRQRGYSPISGDRWDAQYRGGRWDYLNQLDEMARYTVLVGYMASLKPRGAVLDVGCGEGILFKRYLPYGYSKYVGIEISEAALAKLAESQNQHTIFIKADAEEYEPTELFDVVVFNEIVYYFSEPYVTLNRYTHALKQDGVFLISIYQSSDAASLRGMEILRQLKSMYPVVDETQTTQGSRSWLCTVLAPHNING